MRSLKSFGCGHLAWNFPFRIPFLVSQWFFYHVLCLYLRECFKKFSFQNVSCIWFIFNFFTLRKEIKKTRKKGSLLSYLGDKIRKKWLDCKQNAIFFYTDSKWRERWHQGRNYTMWLEIGVLKLFRQRYRKETTDYQVVPWIPAVMVMFMRLFLSILDYGSQQNHH